MQQGASDNAKLYGGVGYNFPWESASSGSEVSASCGADPQCNWRKMFVSAGVAWAIRQYYSATRDRDYMINPVYQGCDMTREIARFLANQAIYDPSTARYNMYSKRRIGFLLRCFWINGGDCCCLFLHIPVRYLWIH